MPTSQLLYLSRADVEAVALPMPEIIDALEVAFRQHGQGKVEMPPKPGVHSRPDAFIHAMPCYIPGPEAIGIKWVAGYPENPKRGLPYITGLLVLNDADTGLPLAVMDCTWITAKRTGAATALAARYLARPDSQTIGILGCGVQGRSNFEALNVLFPVKRVMAFDNTLNNALRYAEEIEEKWGVEVEVVDSPRKAVSGCDIVVTAGRSCANRMPRSRPAGWTKARSPRWSISTPIGTGRRCRRSTSSAPTMCPSSSITSRSAISSTSLRSTPASASWSTATSRAASPLKNAPWPPTWAWR